MDLGVAGVFKVLDPASFLADLKSEQLGIEPQEAGRTSARTASWKYRVTADSIEFRLYEVSKGNTAVLDQDVQARGHRRRASSCIAGATRS